MINKAQFKLPASLLLVPILGICLMLGMYITAPVQSKISAQTANSTKSCETKINKSNCEKAVETECTSKVPDRLDDCRRSTIGRFKDKAAQGPSNPTGASQNRNVKNIGGDVCGNDGATQVKTKFNFGCLGDSYPGDSLSPIEDFLYAIIRFLTAGVGVAVVISIIIAGIKYSASEGNPEETQAAKNRVKSTLIGLLIYIFAFSIVQYLVPGGVFK